MDWARAPTATAKNTKNRKEHKVGTAEFNHRERKEHKGRAGEFNRRERKEHKEGEEGWRQTVIPLLSRSIRVLYEFFVFSAFFAVKYEGWRQIVVP